MQLTWPGDNDFTACQTDKQSFTVQQDPVPNWPTYENPTGPVTFPTNPQNRDWAEISGGYFQPTTGQGLGYDSSGSRSNPYTTAPTTSHVLWKLDPISGMAGLVDEPYGQTAFFSANKATVGVVMYGRGYISGADGFIHCVNTTTGQEIWAVPGSFTLGCVEYTPAVFSFVSGSYNPVLYQIGVNFVKYNALTGAVMVNMTMGTAVWGDPVGPMAPNPNYLGFVQPYAYIRQDIGGKYYLIKFDTTGSTTNLTQRIAWNVSFPEGVRHSSGYTDIGVTISSGVLVYFHFPTYGSSCGFNITNGQVLWNHPIEDVEQKPESIASAYGKFYLDQTNMHFQAFNIFTGEKAWESPELSDGYPWTDFWAYGQSVADNTLFGLSYYGVYAFDTNTGQVKWKYTTGDAGSEEPYGTWPFGSVDPITAGGLVFAPSTEHTPMLYYRGEQLYVLNATTGDRVWNILGYWTPTAVAEGILFATNEYDGCSYAFGTGPSETSIALTSQQINRGQSVAISGSVLDMSPAQLGTPCVSTGSMTAQMEYLHMQQPLQTGTTDYSYYPDGWPNEEVTGVPVTLTATAADGTVINIGQTTTDANGNYVIQWTPPDAKAYLVTAEFAGDGAYYGSTATTTLNVGASSSASDQPMQTVSPAASVSIPSNQDNSSTNTYLIVAVAVAVVVAVVALALVLIKRRKINLNLSFLFSFLRKTWRCFWFCVVDNFCCTITY